MAVDEALEEAAEALRRHLPADDGRQESLRSSLAAVRRQLEEAHRQADQARHEASVLRNEQAMTAREFADAGTSIGSSVGGMRSHRRLKALHIDGSTTPPSAAAGGAEDGDGWPELTLSPSGESSTSREDALLHAVSPSRRVVPDAAVMRRLKLLSRALRGCELQRAARAVQAWAMVASAIAMAPAAGAAESRRAREAEAAAVVSLKEAQYAFESQTGEEPCHADWRRLSNFSLRRRPAPQSLPLRSSPRRALESRGAFPFARQASYSARGTWHARPRLPPSRLRTTRSLRLTTHTRARRRRPLTGRRGCVAI